MDSRLIAARAISVSRYTLCPLVVYIQALLRVFCPSIHIGTYLPKHVPRPAANIETSQTTALGSKTPYTESLLSVLSAPLSKAKPSSTTYTSHKPINKAQSPWLFAKHSAVPIKVQRASSSSTNKPENGAFGTARVTAQVLQRNRSHSFGFRTLCLY